MWFLLHEDTVVQPHAMVDPTAAAHGVFLRVCAGTAASCAYRARGTTTRAGRLHNARVAVAVADQDLGEIQRRAFRR